MGVQRIKVRVKVFDRLRFRTLEGSERWKWIRYVLHIKMVATRRVISPIRESSYLVGQVSFVQRHQPGLGMNYLKF